MTGKPLPEIDDVREVLRYDHESGKLYWRVRSIEFFRGTEGRSADHTHRQWNGARAGKEALASPKTRGYLGGKLFGMHVRAHRVAWALHYGQWPKNEIDHINGIKSDNRISNLRDVDAATNSKNQPMSSKNSSGKIGVSWNGSIGKWHAYITIRQTRHHLGFFSDINEAIFARNCAESKFGFHPNHGRKLLRGAPLLPRPSLRGPSQQPAIILR